MILRVGWVSFMRLFHAHCACATPVDCPISTRQQTRLRTQTLKGRYKTDYVTFKCSKTTAIWLRKGLTKSTANCDHSRIACRMMARPPDSLFRELIWCPLPGSLHASCSFLHQVWEAMSTRMWGARWCLQASVFLRICWTATVSSNCVVMWSPFLKEEI